MKKHWTIFFVAASIIFGVGTLNAFAIWKHWFDLADAAVLLAFFDAAAVAAIFLIPVIASEALPR